jgi:SAM-dependent methyltransferase
MSDYTDMTQFYDLIMNSGYYNYPAIVDNLARLEDVESVLEIGVGTGLILELLAERRPELKLTGVDLTAAMLDQAAERLRRHPHIGLHRQDVVALDLKQTFDVIFSYGGPMYFTPAETAGDFVLISHIREEEGNRLALERLAEHSRPGAMLMLGIQPAHSNYSRPILTSTAAGTNEPRGLRYHQQLTPIPGGFRKQYMVTQFEATVMDMSIDYRTTGFPDAVELLDKCGWDLRDDPIHTPMFLPFQRR